MSFFSFKCLLDYISSFAQLFDFKSLSYIKSEYLGFDLKMENEIDFLSKELRKQKEENPELQDWFKNCHYQLTKYQLNDQLEYLGRMISQQPTKQPKILEKYSIEEVEEMFLLHISDKLDNTEVAKEFDDKENIIACKIWHEMMRNYLILISDGRAHVEIYQVFFDSETPISKEIIYLLNKWLDYQYTLYVDDAMYERVYQNCYPMVRDHFDELYLSKEDYDKKYFGEIFYFN